MRRLAGAFALSLVFLLVPTTAHATVKPVKTAYLYGDSLTYETAGVAVAHMPGWTVTVHAFPGMGACVIRRQMETDLPGLHLDRVTIESFGDDIGDCYTPAQLVPGSTANLAKWQDDLHAMFTLARSVTARVTYVVPPPTGVLQPFELRLTAIAVQEAAVDGVRVSYGPRNSVGGLKYRQTMPCRYGETPALGCVNGQIVVRAPDTIHFCPTGFALACPVYSSGASRFGAALASATRAI